MATERDRTIYKKWYERNKKSARERKSELMRQYRDERPEHYKKKSREAKHRLREKIFDMYGRSCTLCGFNDVRALTLDHIQNNGAEERRLLGERGVYRKATKQYSPDEYRIICMNCQFIQRITAGRENQHG